MKLSTKFKSLPDYLLILSPLILSSLFVYGSKYPAWANTLLIASIFSFIFSAILIYRYRVSGETNKLSVAIILLAILFLLYSSVTAKTSPVFNLFGKGIEEWRGVGMLLFFTSAAYFITLRDKRNRAALIISGVVILYTFVNYLLKRNNVGIANYLGYLNIPMISFAKLVSYPFVYTIVVFVSSIVALTLHKLDYDLGVIKKKSWYLLPLIIILILSGTMLYRDMLRYVASNHYYTASSLFASGDLESAKRELDRASVIAPFDEYYLSKIEVTNALINNFLATNSTSTAAASNIYKDYVSSAISDAMSAVNYDNRSARNYMALGLAYERSMLISGDDGYRNAMDAYDKGRILASDKDYVDVTKAKLSFGAGKMEEAKKYLSDALMYNPNSGVALFTNSQYEAYMNNLGEAISYGERAVTVAPEAIDVQLSLGMLYLENKEYTKAVDTFGKAYTISKGENLASLYYLGVAYGMLLDKTNLVAVIKEFAERTQNESKELNYLNSLLANVGDKTKVSSGDDDAASVESEVDSQ